MIAPEVADVIRGLIVLVGTVTAAYQVALIRDTSAVGQRWRLASIGGACALLAGERVARFGDVLTWEAVGAACVIGAAAVGSWKWRDEEPARPRGHLPGTPRRHSRDA